MLKPALLAVVGLAASVPAAFADTSLPLLPRPELWHGFDPFAAPVPSHEMIDLCGRFGVACSMPFATPRANLGDLATLLPLAQADAAKRWALHVDEWARIADLYREGRPHPVRPLPILPDGLGWRPNRMDDITALMENVQDRLLQGHTPRHDVPLPRPLWQNPLGPQFDSLSLLPAPGPQRPGQSILIVPRR